MCCLSKGGKPTPFDRNLALKMAAKSLDFMINCLETHKTDSPMNAVVIGMRVKQIMMTPIKELKKQTDFE